MDVERELSKMDFSGKSRIRERLRQQLLTELRTNHELSLDELDGVVAAGNPHVQSKADENGKKLGLNPFS